MIFKALAVREGDCFLTEYKKNDELIRILIDGGNDKKETVELFEKLKLPDKHINLIICTHYDSDHINGIIGLLEEGYTFDEIWLPEILGSVAAKIGSKGIREVVEELNRISEEEYRQLMKFDECLLTEFENDFNNNKEVETDIDINFSSNLWGAKTYEYVSFYDDYGYENMLNYSNCIDCSNHNQCDRYNYMVLKHTIIDTVNKTSMLMSLMISKTYSGSKIVWLKNTNSLVSNKISTNIDVLALNSEVSRRRPYISLHKLLKYIYALSKSNKFSLVFKFDLESYPNILFSADSDFNFLTLGENIQLKENSIVTAPHHGSLHNQLAYNRIAVGSMICDKSLTFVRSDRDNPIGRPCDRYKRLSKKYCTKCTAKYARRANVRLTLKRNGTFRVNKKACKCE
ncbi:MBL fold metallo-hydrolase [Clostridium sp. 19966]|uniref:MBL fold metallo-hydrolase n=1 Tax=Clostridium sp. 19966 TaxID=2768166 RepID=UPI0028DE31F7|nr:MBL fold metallo-hydrolase [Clostridium sp. 19966]MDT8719660.1 MBL fold metallo-hydrolase [Clostridium sp. 19966]